MRAFCASVSAFTSPARSFERSPSRAAGKRRMSRSAMASASTASPRNSSVSLFGAVGAERAMGHRHLQVLGALEAMPEAGLHGRRAARVMRATAAARRVRPDAQPRAGTTAAHPGVRSVEPRAQVVARVAAQRAACADRASSRPAPRRWRRRSARANASPLARRTTARRRRGAAGDRRAAALGPSSFAAVVPLRTEYGKTWP